MIITSVLDVLSRITRDAVLGQLRSVDLKIVVAMDEPRRRERKRDRAFVEGMIHVARHTQIWAIHPVLAVEDELEDQPRG